jgi:hypothetical protein
MRPWSVSARSMLGQGTYDHDVQPHPQPPFTAPFVCSFTRFVNA